MSNPFQSILQTPLNKIVPKRKIYTVEPTTTLGGVVQELNNQKIASAPVMEKVKFMGFVSMVDIMAYVVQSRLFDFSDKNAFEKGKVDIEHKSIVPHLAACKKTEGCVRNASNPLYEAIEIFSSGTTHRIAMVGEDLDIENIISQTDVARFVYNAIRKAGFGSPLAKAAAASAVQSQVKVVSIHQDRTLDEAFAQMVDDGVSTIAVVDDNGKLVGNLSPSDYVAVNMASIDCLQLSVRRFLEQFSPKSLSPLKIGTTGTLYAALDSIINNKVHGLWVVDGEGKPVGKVSLTDVMRTIKNVKVEESAVQKLPLPGTLTVQLTGVAELPSAANRATLSLAGGPQVVSKKSDEAKTPGTSPDLQSTFTLDLGEGDAFSIVTVGFHNGNDPVAQKGFPVTWLVTGFGSGNTSQLQSEDVYKLDGGKGTANLTFIYKPK